jgi:hypothetical protein
VRRRKPASAPEQRSGPAADAPGHPPSIPHAADTRTPHFRQIELRFVSVQDLAPISFLSSCCDLWWCGAGIWKARIWTPCSLGSLSPSRRRLQTGKPLRDKQANTLSVGSSLACSTAKYDKVCLFYSW